MQLKDYIGEATAYDKKLMLERKDSMSWLKSVSAFANTQGGRLLFGVADDGVLVGLADAQGDSEFISEAIKAQMDLDAHYVPSTRRNPVIADLFQRLELMERRGSGFKKILDAYAFESEKRGESIAPQLESTNSAFFLTLPNLNYGRIINGVASSSISTERDTVTKTGTITKNIDGTISKNHSSGGGKTAKTSPEVGENGRVERDVGNGTDSNPISKTISKEAWEILKVISECRHISAEQIGRMLGLSASGVRYHIRALTSKSLIKRIGSSKTGHWEVVK